MEIKSIQINTSESVSSQRKIELESWVKTAMKKEQIVQPRETKTEQLKGKKQWVELRFCKTLLNLSIR